MKSDAVSADRLLNALNNGEFEPYIQSVVRASDLTVSGGELLVRWHMLEGEIHLPERFINRVESAGLLPAMTQKIMRQAVNGLSEMKDIWARNFRLAVNVTPALLVDSSFTDACLELAGESSIRLVLELNEQRPFYVTRETEHVLDRLSYAGVSFALDDFGTGCSVLSYLKYFPISYIKIDKSFIQDIMREETSRHITESVVCLAEKLRVETVAEGVETQEQANCLRALGVDYLQGYYFGRPERLKIFIYSGLIGNSRKTV